MKKIYLGLMIVFLSLSLCGCAVLLIGAGVAGGVAISRDTAKLEIDTSFNRAWKVTYSIIDRMGQINLQDKQAGEIQATVKESSITAQITQITSKSVRIEIKARKNLLPNMDLSVEIINKINNRL